MGNENYIGIEERMEGVRVDWVIGRRSESERF
jgi:hypothetical protein